MPLIYIPSISEESVYIPDDLLTPNHDELFNDIPIPPVNKITSTFIWKCEECGTEIEKRDTSNNNQKRFCNKSCAAANYNKNHRKYKSGIEHHSTGIAKSEETISKIKDSISKLDRSGSNNPMYGKTHTEEVKTKLSKFAKTRDRGYKKRFI
jgi:hypothetical protein